MTESIDEEKEEGSVGPNHMDGKDEEEDKVPNPFSILEKGHDSIIYSSDQGKEKIHEVKCKSAQGGCIGQGVEDEGTSSFWVCDLQITAQGFHSCMGGETYFG